MNIDGFYIIYAEPLGKIKHPSRRRTIPQERGRLPSMYEVEVPGLGKRLVRFGNTGNCEKSDNCFICQAPVEECRGGDVPWSKGK